MKTFATAAAAIALSVSAVPASAQEAQAAPGTAASQEHAMQYLRLLYSALQSDKVDMEIKKVLMGCIYGNSMRTITDAMDKAIDANPDKVSRDNNAAVLGVMAGVCGYSAAPQGPEAR